MTDRYMTPEEFSDALEGPTVTYILPRTYRTWLRDGETVLTEIVDRKGVTIFMKKHKLDIFQIRKEPKEWNEL